MMRRILPALLLVAGLYSSATAQTGETPPTIAGATTVAPGDAKKAIEGGALVLDVRRRATYLEGHLPGAKSITHQINTQDKTVDPAAFGSDKAKPIVIYGHGTDGWSAVLAVETAVKQGFTSVLWMREGFKGWQAAKLPIAE